MTRLNLNKIAAAAIREHLAGVIAPTMDTRIDVEVEIHLRCTVQSASQHPGSSSLLVKLS